MADNANGHAGFQDTGNPVLDTTANIVAAAVSQDRPQTKYVGDYIRAVHAAVLEISAKEPNGLLRRGKEGMLQER
ncbi:MAG: hypothetical protein M3552_15520 [Planctomycetota bacterium]|nr:hypothetical protein [Planctomycetaceae bacterium]MDQ3332039.1 hypothetical protein [Planctomycetota bacterium]